MRLKSIYLSKYKNLDNFELNFNSENFIDIFVGKNGTGKSNLFEAFIEIFNHLYKSEKQAADLDFEYKLHYQIEDTDVKISWDTKSFKINNKSQKTIGSTQLPDNILIYYSGHNKTTANIIQKYEDDFRSKIKGAEIKDSRRIIGIGPEYKSLLMAILLSQKEYNKAKKYICNKLGITSVDTELSLELHRPKFADGRLKELGFESIEHFDSRSHYWGADGIVRDFLETLTQCIKSEFTHQDIYNSQSDKYTISLNLDLIQEHFPPKNINELFRQFDNIKTLGMLKNLVMPIKLLGNEDANISYFSDGQFQSVYIYSVMELFKDKNCITLLDEPDSFLHPEWQFQFLKQVFDITETASNSNHVLMSSHSAATLVNYNERQIRLFCIEGKQVKNRAVNKNYAINQLSSNLVKYNEDEQILSILRSINIERKPILFTEGSTDPEIIKSAWNNLYSEPIPFIPIYAFNCVYLRQLLQDNRIINEIGNQPIFGLFDFDEAYNEWNTLNQKDSWENIETDPYKGLIIENDSQNTHAILIPVPRNSPEIEQLVIVDKEKKTHFKHKSKMSIEHIFFDSIKAKPYFDKEPIPGGSEIYVFKEKKKSDFAKKVVPNIEKKYFDPFEDIFKFIKNKC